MKVYKIRRLSDGLYSEAGSAGPWVHFSKTGKTWNHKRHAVMHIKSVAELCKWFKKPNPYVGICEIVEYDLVESKWRVLA